MVSEPVLVMVFEGEREIGIWLRAGSQENQEEVSAAKYFSRHNYQLYFRWESVKMLLKQD